MAPLLVILSLSKDKEGAGGHSRQANKNQKLYMSSLRDFKWFSFFFSTDMLLLTEHTIALKNVPEGQNIGRNNLSPHL